MALRPQMILFGDSITQQSFQTNGWGSCLCNEYSRKADVVLRGYSGYNTRWALYLLNKILPIPSTNPPLVVTIFFGANDASLPDRASKYQHVPVAEYKRNLHRIIDHIKKLSNSTHIVLITPPPIDVKARLADAKYNAHVITTLCQHYSVPMLFEKLKGAGLVTETKLILFPNAQMKPLDSMLKLVKKWQKSDGLHLTPEGNMKLFAELQFLLSELGLQWDSLPWDFPEHLDVDSENPAKTFGPLLM